MNALKKKLTCDSDTNSQAVTKQGTKHADNYVGSVLICKGAGFLGLLVQIRPVKFLTLI